MSYLNMPSGPDDFTKVVISLWFRVPKETIAACAKDAAAITTGNPPLYGIIPLVTFGKSLTKPDISQQQQTWDHWQLYDAFTGDLITLVPVISYTPVQTGDITIDPSYIGVVTSTGDHGQPVVYVKGNFQTTAIATVGGEMIISGCELHYSPPVPGGNPDYLGATTTWTEYNYPRGPQSYYCSLPNVNVDDFADHWHHLLISCDMSGSVSTNSSGATIEAGVSSYNRMWVALDDVNVNGYDAFPNFIGGDDLNAIITDDSYDAAAGPIPPYPLPGAQFQAMSYTESNGSVHVISGSVPEQNDGTSSAPITCSVPSAPVPSSKQLFGLPAAADQVNHIYHVEMAEFMMWIGKTLDTSKESNRRAFVDGKGKPVSPDKKATVTDKQSGSIELLGKPDVMLHKTGNWKRGNNTGTSGVDSEGKKDPDHQFVPTAKIKTYHPDPSLHGPQNPGEKA